MRKTAVCSRFTSRTRFPLASGVPEALRLRTCRWSAPCLGGRPVVNVGSGLGVGKAERLLDAAGGLFDRGVEGCLPLFERVPMGDEKPEVDRARRTQIDVVLHRVLAHAAELFDPECIGSNHA